MLSTGAPFALSPRLLPSSPPPAAPAVAQALSRLASSGGALAPSNAAAAAMASAAAAALVIKGLSRPTQPLEATKLVFKKQTFLGITYVPGFLCLHCGDLLNTKWVLSR